MNRKYLLALAAVLAFTLACSASNVIGTIYEPGDITIVAPIGKSSVSHEDSLVSNGIAYHLIPLTIKNDFTETKTATVLENGVPLQNFSCVLPANSITTCIVPVYEKGTYDFTVQVEKKNGDFVSAALSYTWLPYTELDKLALRLSPSGSGTVSGYIFMIIALVTVFTLILAGIGAYLGRNSLDPVKVIQPFAVFGFGVSLIVVVLVFFAYGAPVPAFGVIVAMLFVTVCYMGLRYAQGQKHTKWTIVDNKIEAFASVGDGSNELGLALGNSLESIAKSFAENRPGVVISQDLLPDRKQASLADRN
jgi:hypothetical protein